MKVGDKVWIPVTVVEISGNGVTEVQYSCYKDDSFWADNTDVKTVTEEDYRNALNEFYEMNAKERSEIWGFGLLKDVFEINAEDFVGRLRKYQDKPKTGQIWKSPAGNKIVVLKADESEVHYYLPSGNESWVSRSYFADNFLNTGEVLTSVATFLKDLEGLNEKG